MGIGCCLAPTITTTITTTITPTTTPITFSWNWCDCNWQWFYEKSWNRDWEKCWSEAWPVTYWWEKNERYCNNIIWNDWLNVICAREKTKKIHLFFWWWTYSPNKCDWFENKSWNWILKK